MTVPDAIALQQMQAIREERDNALRQRDLAFRLAGDECIGRHKTEVEAMRLRRALEAVLLELCSEEDDADKVEAADRIIRAAFGEKEAE